MKTKLLIFTLCIFLFSCDENRIFFDKPQPEGIKNLEKLPNSYIGEYMDIDSTILKIDKNLITKTYKYYLLLKKQEIDTNKQLKIENNYLINNLTNEKFLFRQVNDTFYIEEIKIDTIFNLSENNIAKKFKGNLVLNYKSDSVWKVEIFSLSKNILKQMELNSKDLFDKLSTISENEVIIDSSKTDTLKMILKPTKKEFKEILDLKDSLVKNVYFKIK
jgi:hypothetical protein